MINKKVLKELLGAHEILLIEKALFLSYLSRRNLDFSNSHLISGYLQNYQISETLERDIERLKIESFADLEHVLELLIPKDDRGLNGAFFTPSLIVDEIIRELKPKVGDRCLDPSCGCGAFLLGLIRYFREEHSKSAKEILRENVFGSDILDYNIRRAKMLIAIFALEEGEVIESEDLNLLRCDSLRNSWGDTFEVIVGNPPYVKFQDLSPENREFLMGWETIEKGTFNLYFVFFELGFNLLSEDGRLGYITPNNYFTSLAGESLRRYFQDRKCVYRIADFNHFKVFDAQTYTCLTFLDKAEHDQIRFTKLFDSDLNEFLLTNEEATVKVDRLNVKKWRLLRDSEQAHIYNIETLGTQLRDLFVINVGIATLKDALYFVNRNQDGSCNKEFNGELFEIELESTKPIFKISEFQDQAQCDQNKKRIIYPYERVGDKVLPLSEGDFEGRFPKCFKYLNQIKGELSKRSKTELIPFFQYGRSQGLNKTGIRLLTPTFSQFPKFLLVEESDSLYCNGYGLHFKSEFANGLSLFDTSPIQNKENVETLQRILNSFVMHYYVSHTSVSIQGGYPCYQKNFIELFSVPDFTQEDLDNFNAMSDLELNLRLLEKYQLQGLEPNLAWYVAKRLGINESKVRLEMDALLLGDKNPSATKSASLS